MGQLTRVLAAAALVKLLALCLLLGFGLLLSDYDTSASLSYRICRARSSTPLRNSFWWRATIVWDSVFMTDIACNGYSFDQQYAFFPLLPGMVKPCRVDRFTAWQKV
jgi:phosphatidylinositol glycan class V